MGSPVVDADYLKEIEKARRDLRAIMLRLGWPDAGTYDVKTKSPNGSIRQEEEQTHGSKAGLKLAINLSGPLKTKPPKISYADLYQLAGTVAVEVTGGPTIEFVPGRCDSSLCTQERCMPDAKEEGLPDAKEEWLPDAKEDWLPDAKQVSSHLRDIFYRMGMSDKDIVAISGSHALGRAHPERLGNDGAGSEPLKFSNSYFVDLLCREREGLLKRPTDKALLIDPEFRFYVEQYAKDEDLFFKDYAEAHKKISEPGFNPQHADSVTHVDANSGSILGQSAVGVAVAAAVVILSYIYEVSRII